MIKKTFLLLAVSILLLSGCAKGSNLGNNSTGTGAPKGDVDSDICKEFTPDFVYSVIGKTIVRMEPSKISGVYSCDYFTDYKEDFYKDAKYNYVGPGGPSITIVLDNLNVERQKEARKYLGMTLDTSSKINMENIVSYRTDKSIWSVDLIINPNRFVWANYSHKAITDDQLIDFAAAMADKINGRLKIKIAKNPIDLSPPKVDTSLSQKVVVEKFLATLSKKDIQGAIKMLDANDNTKQGWGVNFNTIKSLEVKSIEPVFQEEWTNERQVYVVKLNVSVTSEGEGYGWAQGANTRWISVQKSGDDWLIHEIANNP